MIYTVLVLSFAVVSVFLSIANILYFKLFFHQSFLELYALEVLTVAVLVFFVKSKKWKYALSGIVFGLLAGLLAFHGVTISV